MINLTIAIPTFERPKNLSNLFNSLLIEYMGLDETQKKLITIYISDNTRSEQNLIKNISLIEKLKKNIPCTKYEKNKYNIGGNQNILKCIEYPNNGWVWVIGDDDILLKGSLKYILNQIDLYNDFSSMTFCSTQNFNDPPEHINEFNNFIITNNVKDYLDNVYLNNACFIPCNIYNTNYYNLFSDRICESTFTQFPHFVFCLMCLDTGYKNLISNKVIVASLPPTWERVHVDSRLFSLLLIPFKQLNSLIAIKKLIIKHRPTFKSKIAFLYRNLSSSINIESLEIYYYSIYKYTSYKNDLFLFLFKTCMLSFKLLKIKK